MTYYVLRLLERARPRLGSRAARRAEVGRGTAPASIGPEPPRSRAAQRALTRASSVRIAGVKLRSPTTVFLHRARLIFMLTALIPTVLMTAIGIIFLARADRSRWRWWAASWCWPSAPPRSVGYTLGTIFVTRGASLAAVQNEFLSSVSHELRTPLTSIRMFIDTLREERVTDPDETAALPDGHHQELGRLDGLVGKLIELSKIESRHAAFERRPVAVADVVEDALAMLRDDPVLGTDVDLDVNVERGLVVHGDRAALAQAVGNLLGNAWKYTPARRQADRDLRRGRPEAGLSSRSPTTASGVPAREQEIIFEKFHRGAAALERGSPGSGLGLAIVRAIVRGAPRQRRRPIRARPRRQLPHHAAPCLPEAA